ncbi:MAG: MmcQ protein, partial [Acetivibrio ethanolgignens]
MTEWIISGNPKRYDVINAFRNLRTIDWTQSVNMEVGDIVYIYVSGDVKAICFRCRVNAVDLEEVT